MRQKEKHDYPCNPVIIRGQDPELFWMHKYGADDRQATMTVDVRALYRMEHIGETGDAVSLPLAGETLTAKAICSMWRTRSARV